LNRTKNDALGSPEMMAGVGGFEPPNAGAKVL
jgi:hypothetical protein